MSDTQAAIHGLCQLNKVAIDEDGNYSHMQIDISSWERIYVVKYPLSAFFANSKLQDLYIVHHEYDIDNVLSYTRSLDFKTVKKLINALNSIIYVGIRDTFNSNANTVLYKKS